MNLSLRSLAFALTAVVSLPLAACGGSITGGGGGGSGGGSTTTTTAPDNQMCVAYCASQLGCLDPSECVLVDAAAAKATCEAGCAKGFAVLDASQTAALEGCFTCVFAGAPVGTCFDDLPVDACKAQCNSPAVEAAGETWSDAAEPAPGEAGGLCTNGMDLFGSGECGGSSDGTTCTLECCNGTCGATPDVAVSCTPDFGDATCTCTAGKNKGKTFQTNDACASDELWNQCNL